MKFGLFYGTGMPPKPAGSTDWAPGTDARLFAETLEQIEFADALGFDYVWFAEHHFMPDYSHFADSTAIIAAATQRTKKIRLGTGIMHLSHRHPVIAAEKAATLDALSGGRFEFGVGNGLPSEYAPIIGDEAALLGSPRRKEIVPEVAKMLASDGLYPGYTGEFYTVPPVNIVTKAIQRPHPPLWLAGARAESTVEAGALGMGSLVLSMLGVEDVKARVDMYWEAFHASHSAAGVAVNPGVAAFSMTHVAPSDAEATARVGDAFRYFFYGLFRGGHNVSVPQVNVWDEFLAFEGKGQKAPLGPGMPPISAFSEGPGNLVGSPETVRRKLREFERTNTDMMVFTQQAGRIEHAHIMESLELLAVDVLPEFRARDADHQRWRAAQIAGSTAQVNSTL